MQQNIYDFSCEGNPIVTFDVSQTYTKKRDPIAWMMVEDRLLSRKNSNIKWMSDPQWREVDDNGFILPKGTSDQNNKRVSKHTGDEGSSEISWSSRAGVQGLKEWLAQF